MSKVPGVNAKHAIITPACRAGHGALEAFDHAMMRLRREYEALLRARGEDGANYHVVVSVEEPEGRPVRPHRSGGGTGGAGP